MNLKRAAHDFSFLLLPHSDSFWFHFFLNPLYSPPIIFTVADEMNSNQTASSGTICVQVASTMYVELYCSLGYVMMGYKEDIG